MRKNMKPILTFIILISFFGCTEEKHIKVSGTVENTLLVAENSTLSYKILTLSNGEKYKLSPEQGKGIGNGFDIELTIKESSNNNEVHAVKIVAIPFKGKKIKYNRINPESSKSE